MGNSTSDNSNTLLCANDKQGCALNGEHTIEDSEHKYVGLFKDGRFVNGIVYDADGDEIESGEFQDGYLSRGSRTTTLDEVLGSFEFTTDSDLVPDCSTLVYVVGTFVDNLLDGDCAVYYDLEHTQKCVIGRFTKGDLVSGEIFSNDETNTTLEKGEFNDYLVNGVALCQVTNPLNSESLELYLKIYEDDEVKRATPDNDYTGLAEYYYNPTMTKLAIKCDSIHNVINGDCIYTDCNGTVLFNGQAINGSAVHGLLYYHGNYVMSHIDDGKPNGDAKLYEDATATPDKMYAEVHYSQGHLVGWARYYTNNPTQARSILYDSCGNLIEEKPEVEEPTKPDPKDVYNSWLETQLKNRDWLSDLVRRDDSYFKDDVQGEVAMLLKIVLAKAKNNKTGKSKKNKNAIPNSRLYADAFRSVLDNPRQSKLPSDFAATLKADICKEFVRYCKTTQHCGLIDEEYYDQIVVSHNDYVAQQSLPKITI